MIRILMTTKEKKNFIRFTDALCKHSDIDIRWATEPSEALEMAASFSPHAMVCDEKLPEISGTDLIKRLMAVNAAINTVLVSTEPEAVFHERTEGLGILAQLPPNPGPSEALDLIMKIRRVTHA